MSKYLEEGCRIFDLIKDRYTDSDGMLVSRIDALSGQIVDNNILVSDFGDYIQNFYLLGKLVGRDDICIWSKTHLLKAARKYQDSTGFFKTKNGSNKIYVWDNADTFEGLSTFYSLSEDHEVLEIINRSVKGMTRFCNKYGLIPDEITSVYSSPFARCDYTGNFVEELSILSRDLEKKSYADLARDLLKPWVNNTYFQKVGMLPNKRFRSYLLSIICNPIFDYIFKKNPTKRSTIVKTNTNMMSGVLQLYLLQSSSEDDKIYYKSLLDHWRDGVERHCFYNGFYKSTYDSIKDISFNYIRPMPDNHHVLALYADIYHYCNDDVYLTLLKRGCDNWLSYQNRNTGLFPEHPLENDYENSSRAIMDCNLDLTIVLLKAAQVCNKKEYLLAAKKCLDGMMKYLSRDLGYIEMVHVNSGEIFVHSKIYTKYMSLFIKGLILMHEALAGSDLYSKELFLIARDR
ncbi:MAG: hypothetical protein GY714_15860 [Desulfobacterales bacterium]|nr:hypothetical protein [Desulfobacterales bacterium]